MSDVKTLTDKIIKFRNERDWEQFHNPKDVAISLVLEAGELLEHFQWKTKEEVDNHIKNNRIEISEEVADILYWILLISHDLGIDPIKSLEKKLEKNAKKYPVKKAKGNHTKYDKL